MSRFPHVSREDLDEAGKQVWDRIAAVRRGVDGPFGVLIHSPRLAGAVAALEDYFRFEGAISDAERELITLATVRETGARFGWAVHEWGAQRSGTRQEAIDAVRALGDLDGLPGRERALVELARSLCRTHTIPEALFSRGLEVLGQQVLLEAVALVGHYSLISCILNGFEVEPPAGGPSFA
jgi:4-carboxymuconolactone decarboxylase